jgi:RNA polymerase sigma-70 factor (ECF subfamily)
MPTVGDDRLIEKALVGRSDAFVELVRRHEQPLAALISRQIADRHQREDVFQETLMQAWRGLDRLRDRSRARAWLIAIARNRCRDHNKSAKRREEPTDDDVLQACVSRTGRDVRGGADAAETPEAILRVPPTQRRTAELFYLKGLTIAEVARRLRKHEGTIKSRLYYARKAMRRFLDDHRPRKE